jgi:hypothetical protein
LKYPPPAQCCIDEVNLWYFEIYICHRPSYSEPLPAPLNLSQIRSEADLTGELSALSCELDASRPSVLLNFVQALELIKDNTNRINFDISKQKVNPRSKIAHSFSLYKQL